MSHVPDDTRLCQMSIPGTHQSLALHGLNKEGMAIPRGDAGWTDSNIPLYSTLDRVAEWIRDNPRCQNRSTWEQLHEGIRVFDMRFDLWTSKDASYLLARHGDSRVVDDGLEWICEKFPGLRNLPGFQSLKSLLFEVSAGVNEGYTLMAVMHSLKTFLSYNAGETVIIRVIRETWANEADFWRAFLKDVLPFHRAYPNLVYVNSKKTDMTKLTMGECRGKIIFYATSCPRPTIKPRAGWETAWIPFSNPCRMVHSSRQRSQRAASTTMNHLTTGPRAIGTRSSRAVQP
jgi:hypothetical protein